MTAAATGPPRLSASFRPFRSGRLKLRELFAADFRDRVVRHVLVDYLEQYWERVFFHDSYACRKGKGVRPPRTSSTSNRRIQGVADPPDRFYTLALNANPKSPRFC